MPTFPKIKKVIKKSLPKAAAFPACSVPQIPTGLGSICPDPTGLATFVLNIALSTVGGIAMLMIAYGGFKVLTASGDPKAVMEGRETITSAVAGLVLVLFSVAILKIVGFNVLGIPYFGP